MLLATYFSPLENHLRLACQLPVAGLHVDAVRAPQELTGVADWLPAYKVLSVGVVDGRNIWRTDPDAALALLRPVAAKHTGPLWVAPSCSLLHVPVSLAGEDALDPELRGWLAFATEKLDEVAVIAGLLDGRVAGSDPRLAAARAAIASRGRPPGGGTRRLRPAPLALPHTPAGAARAPASAAAAHHHHRILPADPGHPRRTCSPPPWRTG